MIDNNTIYLNTHDINTIPIYVKIVNIIQVIYQKPMDFCCAAMEQITGTVQKAEIRQAHENPRWFGALLLVLFGRFWVLEFEGNPLGGFLVTTFFYRFRKPSFEGCDVGNDKPHSKS